MLRYLDLELDMPFVLWCQGEDPTGRVTRERQVDINLELLPEARNLAEPSIVYHLFPLREVRDEAVVLDGGATFRGRLLADRFGLALEVALALCTIGRDLENRVSTYRKEGDAVRAVLLDGIGTAAIGELSDKAYELIRGVAAERAWEASAPFQPGQLDWPLEDHCVFFDLLPAEELGLRLGSDFLMVPSKSVSLAVGLGEGMLPLARERACRYCSLVDGCRFSRE